MVAREGPTRRGGRGGDLARSAHARGRPGRGEERGGGGARVASVSRAGGASAPDLAANENLRVVAREDAPPRGPQPRVLHHGQQRQDRAFLPRRRGFARDATQEQRGASRRQGEEAAVQEVVQPRLGSGRVHRACWRDDAGASWSALCVFAVRNPGLHQGEAGAGLWQVRAGGGDGGGGGGGGGTGVIVVGFVVRLCGNMSCV